MKIPFVKMHGCGNDYIFVDARKEKIPDAATLSAVLSRRRYSVGADGLVLLCSSTQADIGMRIFNADGSEAESCGNALRCVGKILYETGEMCGATATVETRGGIRRVHVQTNNGVLFAVQAEMGRAKVREIKMAVNKDEIAAWQVNIGNPHVVLFVPDASTAPVSSMGYIIEHASLFPARTNVEFAEKIESGIRLRVWERGSGETLACGSGAAAACAAAVFRGLCVAESPIKVVLPGGELSVTVTQDFYVVITGPAERVYEGVYDCGDINANQ